MQQSAVGRTWEDKGAGQRASLQRDVSLGSSHQLYWHVAGQKNLREQENMHYV